MPTPNTENVMRPVGELENFTPREDEISLTDRLEILNGMSNNPHLDLYYNLIVDMMWETEIEIKLAKDTPNIVAEATTQGSQAELMDLLESRKQVMLKEKKVSDAETRKKGTHDTYKLLKEYIKACHKRKEIGEQIIVKKRSSQEVINENYNMVKALEVERKRVEMIMRLIEGISEEYSKNREKILKYDYASLESLAVLLGTGALTFLLGKEVTPVILPLAAVIEILNLTKVPKVLEFVRNERKVLSGDSERVSKILHGLGQ